MKLPASIFLFVALASCSDTQDDSLTNSYEDCLKFATNFHNTCQDTAIAPEFDSIPTETITCDTSESLYCPTNGSRNKKSECSFTRKLCVTCRNDNG